MEQNENQSIEPKKQKRVYGKKHLLIGGAIIIFVAIAISDSQTPSTPSEQKSITSNVEQAGQNTPQALLPEEPQQRIEAIVKNLSPNYEVTVFDKQSNVGKNIKPPFEVLINTDTTSCTFAKQMNFDIMSKLYSDSLARKNIARVRFNARKYLSTSLGGDDAREMPITRWKESGPTNFLKVLLQMGYGESTYKDLERQTWGKELEGCK